MAVITLITDFGTDDPYVAAIKGKMLSKNPHQQVIDITHGIKPYDISQAATVLKSVFRDFPQKTVHLVAVDPMKEKAPGIALTLDDHFFVGFDSGLFSMISDSKPTAMVRVDLGESTFPARDVLVSTAVDLASGVPLDKVGDPLESMVTLFARQLKMTRREITGNVVNVDHYGNLITNISRSAFDEIMNVNGAGTKYLIRFGRESADHTHAFYSEVESGECYALFNSTGYLQIGINQGNASRLLGLKIDAPITIEFG